MKRQNPLLHLLKKRHKDEMNSNQKNKNKAVNINSKTNNSRKKRYSTNGIKAKLHSSKKDLSEIKKELNFNVKELTNTKKEQKDQNSNIQQKHIKTLAQAIKIYKTLKNKSVSFSKNDLVEDSFEEQEKIKKIAVTRRSVIKNQPKNIKINIRQPIQKPKPKINPMMQTNFQSNVVTEELIQSLENLPTFTKIYTLQNSLKLMQSTKERFEYNRENVLEKMKENCQMYYNYKVLIKHIFDYCKMDSNFEEVSEYSLVSDSEHYLNNNYQPLKNFLFLLRNNNQFMLKIIENCNESGYEELSDFLVHFCYEDIFKSSFIQEELLTIIYLLIEKIILLQLPKNLDKSDYNTPSTYLNNTFLYEIFKSLTRRIDVRNFLCSILSKTIYRMETFRNPLTLDITVINRLIRVNNTNNNQNNQSMHNKNASTGFGVNLITGILSRLGTGEFKKKLNNLNKNKKSNPKNMPVSGYLGGLKRTSQINYDSNNDEILAFDKETSDSNKNNDLNKKSSSLNKNNDNIKNNKYVIEEEPESIDKVILDPFYEENSLSIQFIKDKLNEYSDKNNNIDFVMKEYFMILLNKTENIIQKKKCNQNKSKFTKEENINLNDVEIYSNSLLIDKLKQIRLIKQKDNFEDLSKRLQKNYRIVTRLITRIIQKLQESLPSSPYVIKFISVIMEKLLIKKYGDNISYYQKYMFKIQFLLNSIFLPIIKNPDFNGIITNDVISKISEDNLNMFHEIFSKMISGNLYNKNDNIYFTLFNKFILEKAHEIFDLVTIFDQPLPLPKNIENLINSCDKINDVNRNINFDYFSENPDENIKYQSICFSWRNLYIIIETLDKCQKYFMEDNKENNCQKICQAITDNQMTYISNFINGKQNNICDFIYLININYQKPFEEKLQSILKDNFIEKIPTKNNDILTAIKKCISEVLCYANILHKEYFKTFTHRETEYNNINTLSKTSTVSENITYSNYLRTRTDKINPNSKTLQLKLDALGSDEYEDADFINVLFPQIKENIQNELSHNIEDEKSKRIVFCCNYIELYIKNVPLVYKLNNYGKIFMDLIRDENANIQYLTNKYLFQFQLKIKEGNKLNLIASNYYQQIKNMEKCKCVEYLYSKICLPINFDIQKEKSGLIKSITYKLETGKPINPKHKKRNSNDIKVNSTSQNFPIMNFIDSFLDFRQFEDKVDDIIKLEENAGVADALKSYFNLLKSAVKKEKILQRFDKEETDNLIYELENYILLKLYDKLFPSKPNKQDNIFYNKCQRLSFLKPENYIKNKSIVNEKLWNNCIEYINEMENKLTPMDKLKSIEKGFDILQNSISFYSGKDCLGVDDVINPMIYIIIKSKPKNIFSNYDYCLLYLNPNLAKGQYGILMSQLGMIKDFIINMKHTDLIGISEEQFGKDEE